MEKKKVIKKDKVKSKNGIEVELEHSQKIDYKGTLVDRLEAINEKYNFYVSSDTGIGKWYSFTFEERVKTLNDLKKEVKEIMVLPRVGSINKSGRSIGGKYEYTIETYGIENKKDFGELMDTIKTLLDGGELVGYNDEDGVGYFWKKGKEYKAEHCCWGSCNKEKTTLKGIGEFIRSFFEIGYERVEIW